MKDVIKSQQTNEEYKVINGQRVRVNRRKRRSNLNTYYALAIVLVAVVVLILCMTAFFNIKKINISGVSLYSTEQILVVGGASNGANLIRTDTDVIEKRLLDNLAYVDSVTVKKNYPSSLDITVTEAKKAAEIEHKGKYYLLSESGKILESGNDVRNNDIPLIKGFELKGLSPNDKLESEDAFKTKILQQMMEEIKAIEFEDIRVIDLTDRTDIKLDYDGRIEIRLGSSVDMDYKLTYIKSVIDKCLTDDYEGVLRYNGMNSGISAIPKSDTEASEPDSSSVSDESGGEQTGSDASYQDESSQSDNNVQGEYNGWTDNTTDYTQDDDTWNNEYGGEADNQTW